MKIAIFTDCFLPTINGIVTSVVNSSKRLAKKGHKIMIFTSYRKKKYYLGRNIQVKYFKPLNMLKYPDMGLTVPDPRIIREIVKFKPNVIHSHMPSFLGWEAVLCSKIFRIPMVGSYHTLLPDYTEHFCLPKKITRSRFAKGFSWTYTRRYYNRCYMVVAPSESLREELKAHGVRKPITVISNGVDIKKFSPRKVKKDEKTILYVGRVSYEKSIDKVIKAFKMLLKSEPKAKLIIVGSGPELEKLKRLAGPHIDRNIIFKGAISHDKLPRIYSKADFFATASTTETEGLVVLEAMACGLPIIGVNARAMPKIVKHNENGFIAKPKNIKELAKYMKKLLSNPKLRRDMGKKSKEIAQEYSLDNTIDKLEELYNSLKKERMQDIEEYADICKKAFRWNFLVAHPISKLKDQPF